MTLLRTPDERFTDLAVGWLVRRSAARPELITDDVVAAYDAPFPDVTYKAGVQMFPRLVPIEYDQPGAREMRETREALRWWDKPALVMFSDKDPVTRGGDRFFRKLIPTASRESEITIADAGHFLQEEKGEEIAENILSFIARNPLD